MRTRPDGRIVDERDERDPELPDLRDLRERGRQDNPATMTGTGSWQDIKGRFVDDPAGAIAAAEQLVQRAVDDKIRALKDEAAALCARERDDGEASTETMRARLLRCQAYCERLSARSQ
jgi:hypothetical protein